MDKIATIKREVKYENWAAQIQDCLSSGLTVQEWCDQNGINSKTYYYRLRRVREASCQQVPFPIGSVEPAAPTSAVTVHVGNMTVEIADGTSAQTIAAVIRALSC